MKKHILLYPILFMLGHSAFLYTHNRGEVQLEDAWRTLVMSAVGTSVVWGLAA